MNIGQTSQKCYDCEEKEPQLFNQQMNPNRTAAFSDPMGAWQAYQEDIAEGYAQQDPDLENEILRDFVNNLSTKDPSDQFKQPYTMDNAIIAVSDWTGVPRERVTQAMSSPLNMIPETEHPLGPHTGSNEDLIDQARNWLSELTFREYEDMEPEEFMNELKAMPPEAIKQAVERHYDGGWHQFVSDGAHTAKTAAPAMEDSYDENPTTVRGPEKPEPSAVDKGGDMESTESTETWQDDSGERLDVGKIYEMHSPNYQIPDIVKIVSVKPDAIVVETVGEYDPSDPEGAGTLKYQHEITKDEADLDGLTFVKGNTPGPEETPEHAQDDPSADNAFVNTQPEEVPNVPRQLSSVQKFAPMSEYDKYFGGEAGAAEKAKASMIKEYGKEKGEEVFYATVNKRKKSSSEFCPICEDDSNVMTRMASPTRIASDCYKCGHYWETEEEDYIDHNTARREWIKSEDSNDDFWRNYENAREGGASRNLSDIAARDPKLAGKHFTPSEQREFIDEQGVARNADKLDLGGTHYEAHRYLGDKANSANVPDEHLSLGF